MYGYATIYYPTGLVAGKIHNIFFIYYMKFFGGFLGGSSNSFLIRVTISSGLLVLQFVAIPLYMAFLFTVIALDIYGSRFTSVFV